MILSVEMMTGHVSSRSVSGSHNGPVWDMYCNPAAGVALKRGMVLPFTPLSMSFKEVNYHVDMPAVSSYLSFALLYLPEIGTSLYFKMT